MKLPRVYALLDGGLLATRGIAMRSAAAGLLDGGIRLIQIRWKQHFSREVFTEALAIAEQCRRAGAALVVNDRADIALMLDSGLHVGQDDLPASDARRLIGPGRLLGLSTHNENQFRAALAEPVDYLALGPIFTTRTKSNPDPEVGVHELTRLRSLTDRAVVAIGGITRENAAAVYAAGADSVAVVADLYPETATETSIRQRAEDWIRIASE